MLSYSNRNSAFGDSHWQRLRGGRVWIGRSFIRQGVLDSEPSASLASLASCLSRATSVAMEALSLLGRIWHAKGKEWHESRYNEKSQRSIDRLIHQKSKQMKYEVKSKWNRKNKTISEKHGFYEVLIRNDWPNIDLWTAAGMRSVTPPPAGKDPSCAATRASALRERTVVSQMARPWSFWKYMYQTRASLHSVSRSIYCSVSHRSWGREECNKFNENRRQ